MPPDKAKQVWLSCGSAMEIHFGNEDLSSFNDIQTGKYGPPECSSATIIQASVQDTQLTAGSSQMVVYNLMVEINSGPLYRTAIEATREVAANAEKARLNQESNDVNNVGVPKL